MAHLELQSVFQNYGTFQLSFAQVSQSSTLKYIFYDATNLIDIPRCNRRTTKRFDSAISRKDAEWQESVAPLIFIQVPVKH